MTYNNHPLNSFYLVVHSILSMLTIRIQMQHKCISTRSHVTNVISIRISCDINLPCQLNLLLGFYNFSICIPNLSATVLHHIYYQVSLFASVLHQIQHLTSLISWFLRFEFQSRRSGLLYQAANVPKWAQPRST